MDSDQYAIDPDQAGGQDIFGATCEFLEDVAVTWVSGQVTLFC